MKSLIIGIMVAVSALLPSNLTRDALVPWGL